MNCKSVVFSLFMALPLAAAADGGKVLDIVVEADKDEVALGDSVVCRMKMYTTLDVVWSEMPQIDVDRAFWRRVEGGEPAFADDEMGGRRVRSVVMGEYVVHPLQAGALEFRPLSVGVRYNVMRKDVDPFEAFFSDDGGYDSVDTVAVSNALRVKVTGGPCGGQACAAKEAAGGLAIVLDRSTSLMARADSLSPTLYEVEDAFMDCLPADSVPVVMFAAKAVRFEAGDRSWSGYVPRREDDGSAIYDALLSASWGGAGRLLLLADGADNSSHMTANTLVDILAGSGVRVDVVAFRLRGDSVVYELPDSVESFEGPRYVKMKNTRDFSALEKIARATGGVFTLVEDDGDFPPALAKVRASWLGRDRQPGRKPAKGFTPDEATMKRMLEIMAE